MGLFILEEREVISGWGWIFDIITRWTQTNDTTNPTMYETRQWTKYFTEVRISTLIKKPKAKKCSKHRTICFIAHTSKTLARVLQKRNEMQIEDLLGKDKFGFRKGKRTRLAENNIRRTFRSRWKIVCLLHRLADGIWPCKVDKSNANPKGLVSSGAKENWSANSRKIKVLKVRLDQGVTGSVQIWSVVRQVCCLSPIPFNVHR